MEAATNPQVARSLRDMDADVLKGLDEAARKAIASRDSAEIHFALINQSRVAAPPASVSIQRSVPEASVVTERPMAAASIQAERPMAAAAIKAERPLTNHP